MKKNNKKTCIIAIKKETHLKLKKLIAEKELQQINNNKEDFIRITLDDILNDLMENKK